MADVVNGPVRDENDEPETGGIARGETGISGSTDGDDSITYESADEAAGASGAPGVSVIPELEPDPVETTREFEAVDFAEPDGASAETPAGDDAEPAAELSLAEAAATMDSARVLQRRRRARRRRRIKLVLLSLTATTALGAAAIFGFAAWDIQHLTKNLKHTALLPAGFTEPAETVDAYGRSPINILVIGSDTRDTAQDCDLGGDCTDGETNTGANADSEMIVHLSADRSNVTVLSIPRDTETQLPSCAGGGRGMINSALQYGASCQVAAIYDLTGITIDHYIEFDFSGVVDLSDELGGVPVCVSAAVHDPNSDLTIGAGTTNVEGIQALEFLRTRDAFYDGSDLGREQATHIFLSSLLRKVKSSATLTNLTEMQSIAETVSKYTAVDNGLDSATALFDLADDFGEVDSNRVTFLTMPWDQDTDENDPSYQDRLQVDPSASTVFADIKDDKSFTTAPESGTAASASATTSADSDATPSTSTSATGSASASTGAASSTTATSTATPTTTASGTPNASEEAAARAHPMHVDVVNASGTTDRYQTVQEQVFQDGFVYTEGSNATATQSSTTLVYPAKEASAAEELATALDLPSSALKDTGTGTAFVLTIGTDWTSGSTYSAADSSYSPSDAISVPADSYEENAATTGECVTANPDYETGSSSSSNSSQ